LSNIQQAYRRIAKQYALAFFAGTLEIRISRVSPQRRPASLSGTVPLTVNG